MKNFKVVVVALVMSIAAISCSSDDDNNNNNTSNNVMSIAGEEFDIAAAGLEDFGENADGSYDWDVLIFWRWYNYKFFNSCWSRCIYLLRSKHK